MDFYNFFWGLCGNEFATQLLLTSFLFMPWRRRRKFFMLRFLPAIAVYTVIGRYVPTPAPWGYLIMFACLTGMIFLSFKGNIIEALFHAINSYCVQFIISTISYSISFVLYTNKFEFNVHRIIMPIVMGVIVIVTFFVYTFRNFNTKVPHFSSPHLVIAGAIFITVAVFLSHYAQGATYYGYDFSKILISQIFIKCISCLCATIVLLVNYMNFSKEKLKIENSILQILLQKDKEQYENAKLAAERINIKLHDIKHNQNKSAIPNDDDDVLPDLHASYYTGNKALDIIVGEKNAKCKSAGINLICVADGKALDFVKPHHIYSILGNAIDNAIEGLKNVDDAAKRAITLSVTRRGNMCLIKTSNYVDKEVVFEDGLPKTTKKDTENHGYGTKSMRNIIENYKGEIYFSVENNVFTLLMMLPIPQK